MGKQHFSVALLGMAWKRLVSLHGILRSLTTTLYNLDILDRCPQGTQKVHICGEKRWLRYLLENGLGANGKQGD
jgi:hypothetical protein